VRRVLRRVNRRLALLTAFSSWSRPQSRPLALAESPGDLVLEVLDGGPPLGAYWRSETTAMTAMTTDDCNDSIIQLLQSGDG
jgi:hypothetical protein